MKAKLSIILLLIFLIPSLSLFSANATSSASKTVANPSEKDNSELVAEVFNEIVEKNRSQVNSSISNNKVFTITYPNLTTLDNDLSFKGTLTIKTSSNDGKKATLNINLDGIVNAVEDGYRYNEVPIKIEGTMAVKLKNYLWDTTSTKLTSASLGAYAVKLTTIAKEMELD